MEQRYQAVLAVIRDGVPVVEVAGRFGVSRQAVHRWLRWYEDQGLPGLVDRSHRPPRCSHQMDPAVEVWVLETRRRNPDWGPRRLVHEAVRAGRRPGAVALGDLSGAQASRPDRPRRPAPQGSSVQALGAGRCDGAVADGRRRRGAARRRHGVQGAHRHRRPLPVRRLRRGDDPRDQPGGLRPLRRRDASPRRPPGDPDRQRQGVHRSVRTQRHRGAVRPDLPGERHRSPADRSRAARPRPARSSGSTAPFAPSSSPGASSPTCQPPRTSSMSG